MSEPTPFLQRVLDGDVLDPDNAIDDAIDEWHESPQGISLAEWLGMTEDEYALFVEQPNALKSILQARKYGMDLRRFITSTDNAIALAARGANPQELAELTKWLKQTGRF